MLCYSKTTNRSPTHTTTIPLLPPCPPDVLEILRNHTLVGVVDLHHALLQHGTRLYLVTYTTLLKDLFYQLALLRFQQTKCVAVEPPMPVGELVVQGLEAGQKLGTWQVRGDEVVGVW